MIMTQHVTDVDDNCHDSYDVHVEVDDQVIVSCLLVDFMTLLLTVWLTFVGC